MVASKHVPTPALPNDDDRVKPKSDIRCSRVSDSERHSCRTPSRGSLAGSGLTGRGLRRLRRSYAPSCGVGWSDIRAESPTATGRTAGLRGRSSN